MGRDTRISLGLALLYLFNGLSGLTGSSASFIPAVHFDFMLLAFLSLTFSVLPPYKTHSLAFFAYTILFIFQYLMVSNSIAHKSIHIVILVAYIIMIALSYAITLLHQRHWLFLLPAVCFLTSLVLGYFEVNAWLKLGISLGAAAVQIYVLARPDFMEKTPVFTKRFYLLNTVTVFFDLIYMLFIKLNHVY